jgi:hypothetical protein
LPINILKEPRNKKYRYLIQYAFKKCESFVFAMQNDVLTYYGEPTILKMLKPYKINELKAIFYPQIDYYNEDTVFYFYKCNEDTKSIIMNAVNGLYEWRYPNFPEDLTFIDNKGEVWLSSISHEDMAGINEKSKDEVEFIKNCIGLEIYWREKIYNEDEVGDTMGSLFKLIEEYFYLLGSNSEAELNKELANKQNSAYYGFWNDFFSEYDINEHRLAFEIARFSNLLRLNKPIYANDFSSLLDDKVDNSYLVQLLIKNINSNSKILYEFIKNFKLNYRREK